MSSSTATNRTTHSPAALLALFRRAIPPLDGHSHKGQHGRIAIVGGSTDYIGAPYFAAMAAFRAGSDLTTVFCAPEAAIPIKSLSPDIVVTPTLRMDEQQLKRIRSIVIGPGLGRNYDTVQDIIHTVRGVAEQRIPLVLDADALWWLANDKDFADAVRKSSLPIITPNAPEAARLEDTKGFACIAKGANDIITVGDIRCEVGNKGAPKRVGGQGDILAGITALFVSWVEDDGDSRDETRDMQIASAAVAASAITRRAASIAFDKRGRSLVTSDILEHIGQAVTELEEGSLLGLSQFSTDDFDNV